MDYASVLEFSRCEMSYEARIDSPYRSRGKNEEAYSSGDERPSENSGRHGIKAPSDNESKAAARSRSKVRRDSEAIFLPADSVCIRTVGHSSRRVCTNR